MMRSIVVFPDPEAPRSTKASPAATSKLTSSSTRVFLKLLLKPRTLAAISTADMVPPVAVQVTDGGADDPSLQEPDTVNCCESPGASVIEEGVTTSAVRVGLTGGGGGGVFGPVNTSAASEEAQLPVATASRVPRMAPAVYTLLRAIVIHPRASGDRGYVICRVCGPAPAKIGAAGHGTRGRQVR